MTDTTGGELREALIRWLAQRYGSGGALEMRGFLEDADALVRGPLRDLIAERDTFAAQVQAVESELDDLGTSKDPADRLIVRLLRRALGTPTTGGGE